MPAKKINQPVNTFVGGLITEASPLTFPENASLDEVNFRLCRDGSRERRLGMDYLFNQSTSLSRLQLEKMYGSLYKWEAAQIDGDQTIGVVQVGNLLYFIDLYARVKPKLTDPIPLLNGGVPVDTGLSGGKPIEFATLNGYLLLLCEELPNPYLAYYNKTTDVVTFETANIQIRDFYGVDDGLAINERPTTLSETHRYNLRNQGWTSDITTTCGTDVLDCTFSTLGYYPSNSDTWLAGKIGDLTDANVDKYDPNIAARNFIDAGQVPRGHYILDLYNRGLDRHNHTGTTLPTDHETNYASTIAAYAGRAWYSGIKGTIESSDSRSPRLSNAVLFSQVFTDKINLIKCFQEADPTSWKFNEVVDTDGGVIHIPGCSGIRRLFAQKQSLFVFADNGVWEIRGPTGTGFTATSFEVKKINSFGISAKHSIVDAMGNIFYWGYSGIYAILPDPNMDGVYTTQNVTQRTIQTRYDEIDSFAKRSAKGIYDPYNNKIRWLFSDGENDSNYYSIAECNHMPQLNRIYNLAYATLITRKQGYTPDHAVSYLYLIRVNQLTNAINVVDRYTLASSGFLDILGHTITIYSDYLYYFYRDLYTNNDLIVKKLTYDSQGTEKLSFTGSPVIINSACANTEVLMASCSLSSTRNVVAFHNTSGKVSLQVVKDDLTYGAVVSTTNSSAITYPISIIAVSDTAGVVCYTVPSTKKVYLDYFTVSGTTITIASSTDFITTTQMPTGTTECYEASIAYLEPTKYLVTCRIRNTTLGYTDVVSTFIVTRSGSTLTSTTILNNTGDTGTNPKASAKAGWHQIADSASGVGLVIYEDTVGIYTYLKYIKLDTSGTTPVVLSSGTMMNTGIAFDPSHVHTDLFVDTDTIISAFRDIGSLGVGSSAAYVMDI